MPKMVVYEIEARISRQASVNLQSRRFAAVMVNQQNRCRGNANISKALNEEWMTYSRSF